jgi:hypothetical protein
LSEVENGPDWRIAVSGKLTHDVPAAFPGGPSHKAGTPIYTASLTKDSQHNLIGFVTPNPTALALNAASRSASTARALRSTLALTNVVTPYGGGKSVANENLPHLYDFFEHCMIAVTCSFQAIEMFCNQTIVRHSAVAFTLKRGKESISLSAEDLERRASTEEKVATIVPQTLGLQSPKGTKVWENFLELKAARDSTIHFKTKEMKNDFGVDRESLFFQSFRRQPTNFPETALDVISYLHREGTLPSWIIELRGRINVG